MERTQPLIDITLLGTFGISVDGKSAALPYDKPKLLCAYLIAEGRSLYRSHIASLLWPERSDHHARQNLRQALAALNRVLGDSYPELFATSRQTIEFVGYNRCQIDTERLKHLSQLNLKDGECVLRLNDIDTIHTLYRGPFCQGIKTTGCDDFDEWVDNRRAEYQSLAINIARGAANCCRCAGDTKHALEIYTQMLSIDRHDESLIHEFMEYLIEQGRRPQAINLYRDYERRLEHDLGIKPSAQLSGLHEILVHGSV